MKYIHTAFRNGLEQSQAEIKSWATLGEGDPEAILDRFAMIHEALAIHEMAEEEVLFAAVNAIEAGQADVFFGAHRAIDDLRDGILDALQGQHADRALTPSRSWCR